MREYIDNKTAEELYKYLDFRKATNLYYEDLYYKHVEAVKQVDEARERGEPSSFPIMAMSPGMYAYLTDLALQYLALGASIYHGQQE